MEVDPRALLATVRSWYPIAHAKELQRTWLGAVWIFKSPINQHRTARRLIMRHLHDIRVLEQQVQSSRHPDRMRILLIRAQASASQLALEMRWNSEAVRLAKAFRSELEIAVTSPGLSRKDAGVIGDMGPKVMQMYDEIMPACGQSGDT
jgi:hypothetical protein